MNLRYDDEDLRYDDDDDDDDDDENVRKVYGLWDIRMNR